MCTAKNFTDSWTSGKTKCEGRLVLFTSSTCLGLVKDDEVKLVRTKWSSVYPIKPCHVHCSAVKPFQVPVHVNLFQHVVDAMLDHKLVRRFSDARWWSESSSPRHTLESGNTGYYGFQDRLSLASRYNTVVRFHSCTEHFFMVESNWAINMRSYVWEGEIESQMVLFPLNLFV